MYYFDELIIAEIRKKNEVALQELYKMHYPMIVHLVCTNMTACNSLISC